MDQLLFIDKRQMLKWNYHLKENCSWKMSSQQFPAKLEQNCVPEEGPYENNPHVWATVASWAQAADCVVPGLVCCYCTPRVWVLNPGPAKGWVWLAHVEWHNWTQFRSAHFSARQANKLGEKGIQKELTLGPTTLESPLCLCFLRIPVILPLQHFTSKVV